MAENSLPETGPLALVSLGRRIVYSEVNVGMLAAGISLLSYALVDVRSTPTAIPSGESVRSW